MLTTRLIACTSLAVSSVTTTAAPQWGSQQDARIFPTPNDLSYGDRFGGASDLDGSTLIVGASWHDPLGTASGYGAVYVFERSGGVWSESARLIAGDFATFDHFGSSVALDGDTLAVGAEFDNAGTGSFGGSAYVFARSERPALLRHHRGGHAVPGRHHVRRLAQAAHAPAAFRGQLPAAPGLFGHVRLRHERQDPGRHRSEPGRRHGGLRAVLVAGPERLVHDQPERRDPLPDRPVRCPAGFPEGVAADPAWKLVERRMPASTPGPGQGLHNPKEIEMNTRAPRSALLLCAATAAVQGQSLLDELHGTQTGARFGYALAGGLDFDGDGHDDLLVGVPYADQGGLDANGLVRVISGADGSTLFQAAGDDDDDHFGWSLDVAGDVDADGWQDLVVGAPNASTGTTRPGMVRTYSGRTGSVLYTRYGVQDQSEFGYAVAGGLDFAANGQADILVGAPGEGAGGHYYVFGDSIGGQLYHSGSAAAGSRVGAAVAVVGDVDLDGRPDSVVGAPEAPDSSGAVAGRVTVQMGGSPYSVLHAEYGTPGSGFGSALSRGLDADLDGRAESFLVGAPRDSSGLTDMGSVTRVNAFAGTVGGTWHGEAALDRMGTSVALLGDIDGDGVRDFVAGALELYAGGVGSARVFSVITGEELYRAHGQSGTRFGSVVANAGDYNADGFEDFAVGAPNAAGSAGQSNAGLARVFSGSGPGIVPYCTAGTSASGCRADLNAVGTPSATSPANFWLYAWYVEGDKMGIFFYGANGRQANPWGNGSSFQCVAPPVKRSPQQPKWGNQGQCNGAYYFDLNAHWCPTCPKAHHNFGAGAVVQAQLWYRDPQNTSNQTTSLSNAVEFVTGP